MLKFLIIPFLFLSAIPSEAGVVRMVQTPDAEIRVFIDGTNSNNVILMLHGGPGIPDYLDPVAGILKDQYMVVRFDQRGTGGSTITGKDYSIEKYTSDIDAVMDSIGIQKFHLFGHSWGGLLAQIYASGHKDRIKSLFLLSPTPGTGGEWQESQKEVTGYNLKKAGSGEKILLFLNFPLAKLGSDSACRTMFGKIWTWYFRNPKEAPPADPEWLKGIHAEAANETPKGIIKTDAAKLDESFSNAVFPVLIAYGKYDIYGKSREYTFNRFKKAQVFLFEKAGHLPWLEDKETFVKALKNFYSGK